MKLFLIKGFDYDMCEAAKCPVATVCKSREEVETKLQEYIDEARYVFNSYLDDEKVDYTETHYRHNGNSVCYIGKMCLDMANPVHRKAYIDIISENWLSAEDYQWSESINSHTRELTLISLSVKEVEV